MSYPLPFFIVSAALLVALGVYRQVTVPAQGANRSARSATVLSIALGVAVILTAVATFNYLVEVAL